jgi:electron transfer flavoprotein alpha subunit
MNNWLVFLEQREGVVKQSSIETWNKVQELAALRPDAIVSGLLAGPADIRLLEARLAGKGVICHASDEMFRRYHPEHYLRLVADILTREGADSLFFADTVLSRDLAPRLSVRLQASLLSGCPIVDDTWSEDGGCRRPVYSGSVIASFAPLRPLRIYTATSRSTRSTISFGAHIAFVALDQPIAIGDDLFSVVSRIAMHAGIPDVSEASIIVAGGRGMGGREGFAVLEELARLLGGAVGASRPVVDEGWRPHAEQIGQTGKTVAPSLYVACAISGSLQHLAGIGSAGTVVAINSDPHAPIFDVADYGIVGDVHIVLPKLLEALQEFLKKG